MRSDDSHTRASFIIAVVLHGILLLALLINIKSTPQARSQAKQPSVEIVKAVSVDQSQLNAEISRLRHEKQAKQAHEELLVQQAAQALKQKVQEQKRLAQLQKEIEVKKQTYAAEQKAQTQKLAELKQNQDQEKEHLQKIKEEAEQTKQKQAAEAKRLQEAASQAEAKKLAEAKQQAESAAAAERLKQSQAAQAEAQAQEAVNLREMDKYKALILQAISQRWLVPDNITEPVSCRLLIRVAPDGTVLDVQLVQSSGNSVLDRSALAAVYKASPLPVPTDPNLFEKFRTLNLTVRPEGAVS